MGFIIVLLTVVMVLVCLVLVFLVLLQLPKKEAGAGLAFGSGATDALFGAGSGNVLTKITKYTATTFFVLALLLGALQSYSHNRGSSSFATQLAQPSKAQPAAVPPPAAAPATKPTTVPPTNAFQITSPVAAGTNAPTTAPTNPAPTPEAPK